MADTSIVTKLDEKLMNDNIIEALYAKDYGKVHKFLNKEVKKYDKALKADDFSIAEKDLREWLKVLHKQGASQEKLTSYLRCGLAHLCFDYIDLKVDDSVKNEDHITRAFQSFKKRSFHKSFFKSSAKN